MTEILTRDNKPFKLGDSLWTELWGEYKTSPETHEITIQQIPSVFPTDDIAIDTPFISRKGTKFYTQLNRFFSSREAAIDNRIKENEAAIDRLRREIEHLEEMKAKPLEEPA